MAKTRRIHLQRDIPESYCKKIHQMELFGNFGVLMKSHKCWSSESDFSLDSFPKLNTGYVQDNCNSSELITVWIVC
jgi:hypothetical protein